MHGPQILPASRPHIPHKKLTILPSSRHSRRTTPETVPTACSAPLWYPAFLSQHFDLGAVFSCDAMNVNAAHPFVFSHAR